MFPGQGSQYLQMGSGLFEHDAVFRESMLSLDGIAKELVGVSVVDVLYSTSSRKDAVFDSLTITHPAIFMVQYSVAKSLINAGIEPSITLGVSLGAFAAATISGFIDVESALAAVTQQAAAIEGNCQRGGMLAVLADAMLFHKLSLSEYSEIAAINLDSHFVVAGQKLQIDFVESKLKGLGITLQRLPVSFAFHTRWIDAARPSFIAALQTLQMKSCRMPTMNCSQGVVQHELTKDYFWEAARNPIRFRDSINVLEQVGPCRYIDVGPSGTLATFLKYQLASSSSKIDYLLTPYGDDTKSFASLVVR